MTEKTFSDDVVNDWHEDVENPEGYRSGRYRPTHLGDHVSDGRYRIVHDLSFGLPPQSGLRETGGRTDMSP